MHKKGKIVWLVLFTIFTLMVVVASVFITNKAGEVKSKGYAEFFGKDIAVVQTEHLNLKMKAGCGVLLDRTGISSIKPQDLIVYRQLVGANNEISIATVIEVMDDNGMKSYKADDNGAIVTVPRMSVIGTTKTQLSELGWVLSNVNKTEVFLLIIVLPIVLLLAIETLLVYGMIAKGKGKRKEDEDELAYDEFPDGDESLPAQEFDHDPIVSAPVTEEVPVEQPSFTNDDFRRSAPAQEQGDISKVDAFAIMDEMAAKPKREPMEGSQSAEPQSQPIQPKAPEPQSRTETPTAQRPAKPPQRPAQQRPQPEPIYQDPLYDPLLDGDQPARQAPPQRPVQQRPQKPQRPPQRPQGQRPRQSAYPKYGEQARKQPQQRPQPKRSQNADILDDMFGTINENK